MIKDFLNILHHLLLVFYLFCLYLNNVKIKKNFDKEIDVLENRIDSLQRVNNGLLNDADEKEIIVSKLKRNNDSLEKVKTQIKQNYVIKIKQIDTLSPNGLVNEFRDIFSAIN